MLIGIGYQLGSGKDTVARMLQQMFDDDKKTCTIKSWADNLKKVTSIITGVDISELYSQDGKMKVCPIFNKTYRVLLQEIGTDVMRNTFDQDVWVKSTLANCSPDEIYIIPDTRFPNEAQAVKSCDGILIKVVGDPEKIRENATSAAQHESEIALALYDGWDFIIENNSTIEDLYEKVKLVYNQIKNTCK